jgi:hypothetical protein
MTKPTKKSEHASPGHHAVKVVTKHRLADGAHSSVFPDHGGGGSFHPGARNGHAGSHTVTSKGRK